MSDIDDNLPDDVRVHGLVPTTTLPVLSALPQGVGYNYATDRYIDSAGAEHTTMNEAQLATLRHNSQPGIGHPFVLVSTPHREPNELEAMWRAAEAAPDSQGGRVMYTDQHGNQHRTIESARAVTPPWQARPDLTPIPITPLNEQFYFNGNVYATRSEMQAAIYAHEREVRNSTFGPPTEQEGDGTVQSTNGPPIVMPDLGPDPDTAALYREFARRVEENLPPQLPVRNTVGNDYYRATPQAPAVPVAEEDRWYGPDAQRRARETLQEASRIREERTRRQRSTGSVTITPLDNGQFTISVGIETLKEMTQQPGGQPWLLSAADLAGVLVNRMLRYDGTQSPIHYFLMQMLNNTWPDPPTAVAPAAAQPHRYERTIHLDPVPEPPQEEG